MNRAASISLIVLAAAGGFAAGWRTDDSTAARRAASGAVAAGVNTAAASNKVTETTDAPPSLPELNTVEECREFLRTAAKQFATRHPFTRQAVRDYALRRWLELDAESALQEAERQPGNEYADTGFAPELFRVWLDLNVDSAIEGWTQANPLLAKNVRVAFLTALADKDPARAFEMWKTPRGKSEHEFYDPAEAAIFARWAQTDPKGVLQKFLNSEEWTIKPLSYSFMAAPAIWKAWAAADPVTAFAELRKAAPDFSDIGSNAANFLPWLTRHSPADAAAVINAITSSTNPHMISSVAGEWLQLDTEGAVKWALSQSPPSTLAIEVTAKAARELATSDPLRAIEMLKHFEKTAPPEMRERFQRFDRSYALRETFASLAATDPQKAQELLAAEPELAKNGGLAGYLTYAFAGDSEEAIAQTRAWLRDPALKEAAADGAMMAFRWGHGAGARDSSELLAAIPELADKVDGDVLSGWAKANPTGAADFIMERLRGGHEIKDLQSEGVLAELAISRPEYTGVWLQRLPEGDVQQHAAKTLAANWSAFDPEAAAAWINSLPEGALRDAAVEAARASGGEQP